MQKNSHQILIVDDNPVNIDILVNTLKDNYSLGIAKDGLRAIEYTLKYHPQLILLDIMMPGMDGFEVCSRIKSTREMSNTGIIFITAMNEPENITKGFEYGALDYITKPFNTMEVKSRIKTHLSLIDYRDHLQEMVKLKTDQLEKANTELKDLQVQIINRLGMAAEFKDNDTGKHVIRVGLYSGMMADALGLGDEKSEMIRLCAPMHDIGKIGIPDDILLKKGSLDDKEWNHMKQHCQIGFEILSPESKKQNDIYKNHPFIESLVADVKDYGILEMSSVIALSHHERWDGTGYPEGTKGDAIPVEARITSIADVYDALSSTRSYKEPYPEEKCREIIREGSGTQFDPDVVSAFFDSIDEVMKIKHHLMD